MLQSMVHIMYRNNKANLWLRTICVTVALFGMLFFTHSQFSIAAAPMSVEVTFSTTDTSDATPLEVDDSFTITAVLELADSETISGNVRVTYLIGTSSESLMLTTSSTGSPYTYSGSVMIESGKNGTIAFSKIRFATNVEVASDYTTTTAGTMVTVMFSPSTINVATLKDITDPTSIAVDISADGDDTTVTPTETITASVVVDHSDDGQPNIANVPTLQYKIGESGTSTDLNLVNSGSALVGTITVDDSTAEGAFIFISVTLYLTNPDAGEVTETKVYDSSFTSVLTVTDAGLTIKTVADPMSIAVDISADGDDSRVTNGETITVAVTVTNDATSGLEGLHDHTTAAPVLTYKIGDGDNKTLTLMDNTTHWIASVSVTESFTDAGTFTFVSLTLSLKNAGSGTAVRTYVDDGTILALTDAKLTIGYPATNPNLATLDLNITADGDDALGVDDKITFTAKVSNNTDTDGNVLSVKVHYKIKETSDSIVLVKGVDDTWSAVLTINENTASGNLTFVSIEIGLENRNGKDTATRTYDASQAKIEGALNITIDVSAPVDNATSSASATSSADSASSSSETSSDSPVSILAIFLLIASVSMAVGVYTLRRRQ